MKTQIIGILSALMLAPAAALAAAEHSEIGDPGLFGLVDADRGAGAAQQEVQREHGRIGDLSLFSSAPEIAGPLPGVEIRVEASGRSNTAGGDAASGVGRLLP